MKAFIIIILTGWMLTTPGTAQKTVITELERAHTRDTIRVPDIRGLKAIKCDFHMHTVFSDGLLWPEVRVQEAWEEGLDAIAITDHIEYQPHKTYVSGSLNSSYELALPKAKELGILLIHGGEITREMPPGHLNVLFAKDVERINLEDDEAAIMEAYNQGAFIFWNHPCWKKQQPDSCIMFRIHKDLIKNKIIAGIEVFNEIEWYPCALDWCLENNLAVISSSDIHEVTAHYYAMDKWRRPMTLVFASEKTHESLKYALFAGQTVAWFGKYIAGREDLLNELFIQSISIKKNGKTKQGETIINLTNTSDFIFEISSIYDKNKSVVLYPDGFVSLRVKPDERFKISNWFTGSDKNLIIHF